MDKNFYCNGEWFDSYEAARAYSDIMVKLTGEYHCWYSKEERNSINVIDHEMECGK
jgi:hypothetical protein